MEFPELTILDPNRVVGSLNSRLAEDSISFDEPQYPVGGRRCCPIRTLGGYQREARVKVPLTTTYDSA